MGKIKNIVRNIYLYLAVFVGLMMIVIPSIDLIKIGLETWVFPLAAQEDHFDKRPLEPYTAKINADSDLGTIKLTEAEKNSLKKWQENYTKWEEEKETTDYVAIERQKSLVRDISTLIGGLALFLAHGIVLRREKKHTA